MLLNAASAVTAAERTVTRGRIPIHSLLAPPDEKEEQECVPMLAPPPELHPTVIAPCVPTPWCDAAPLPFSLVPPALAGVGNGWGVVGDPHCRIGRIARVESGTSSSTSSEAGGVRRSAPRRRWKPEEDALLVLVVRQHGPGRWNRLAEQFPGRNGRQVRLRWVNHLQPSLDKREWRPEEDHVLLAAHEAHGNKWAQIASKLSGRTDNSVKNRFKSLARRAQREARARIR